MCYKQIAQALIGAGTAYAGAKAARPGRIAITPAAKQQDVGDASTKSDLAAEQRKKKGIRSTILAGGETSSTGGGNTLLGGG